MSGSSEQPEEETDVPVPTLRERLTAWQNVASVTVALSEEGVELRVAADSVALDATVAWEDYEDLSDGDRVLTTAEELAETARLLSSLLGDGPRELLRLLRDVFGD